MIAQSRYSPDVALTLLVGERRLALSHVGPFDLTVREACEPIPPSNAKLVITIDNETESYPVFLPDGIPSAPQKVAYF
jgi:hypothetical protein